SACFIAIAVGLIGALISFNRINAQNGTERFDQFDRDGNGVVTKAEAGNAAWYNRLLRLHDRNRNGVLERSEIAETANSRTLSKLPPGIVRHPDLRFGKTAGVLPRLQSLDVYTPKSSGSNDDTSNTKLRPVFLFVHGGSWKKGDKENGWFLAKRMIERGYIFASTNYRLLPKAKFPENAVDVAAAVAWMRAHAAEYGGDPDRIILVGHSAGAHLAALVGTDERYLAKHGLKLSTIKGVISLDTLMYDVVEYAKESNGRRRVIDAFGDGADRWRSASPALQAARNTDVPPIVIAFSGGITGGRADPRKVQADRFADALRTIGGKAIVIDAGKKTHREIAQEFDAANDHVAGKAFEFLDGIKRPATK
ncbi:MAG: alpha/beta hydrolase, partial [Planctomycetota bacterium]